jgi:hypothetical protein
LPINETVQMSLSSKYEYIDLISADDDDDDDDNSNNKIKYESI